jgi:hypothetical protein
MSSGTSALRTWWAGRPPAAGAAVMATGIVSVGLHLTGHEVLSGIALVLGSAAGGAVAEEARSGPAVDRGGRVAGGGRRGGRVRAVGAQVHSTAMKTFTRVNAPTSPNSPFSTFSSSRFT